MKLQINDRGAWRNSMEFAPDRLDEVMLFFVPSALVNPKSRLRIVETAPKQQPVVLFIAEGPDFEWKASPFRSSQAGRPS